MAKKNTDQSYADFIGLPDEDDIRNIQTIIKNYDHAFPGEIKAHIELAKLEGQMLKNEWGTTGQDKYGAHTGSRRALTLPVGLLRIIEEAYPLMFKERKYLHWFQQNFPGFNIAQRGHRKVRGGKVVQ